MKNTNSVKHGMMYLAFMLMWVAACPGLYAQTVFSEDFEQGLPDSFQLVNGDQLTPHPNVSIFDEAWIALFEDDTRTNIIMASNSWYQPPGQADDWMMTPVIDMPADPAAYTLQWRAQAADPNATDGYQVLLSTDADRTVESYTTVLFEIAEENTDWTVRTADLASFAGQSISIAFRNNSNDKFLLFVDDISVGVPQPVDLSVTGVSRIFPEFTRVPLSQSPPFNFEAEASNFGSEAAQKVVMDAEVWTITSDGFLENLLFSTVVGDTLDSLAAGQVHLFSGGGSFIPPDVQDYAVLYIASSMQADGDSSNNFAFAVDSLSGGVFARDDATERDVQSLVAFSIATGNGGIIGNTLPIATLDTLTSISATFIDPPIGQTTQAVVYLMGNNEPAQLLYESAPYTFTEADNPNPDGDNQPRDKAEISFPLENAVVFDGAIFIGVREDSLGANVAGTPEIYTQGTTFLFAQGANPDQGVWVPGEDAYGENFRHTFGVRAHFGGEALCRLDTEVVTTQDDGTGNGTAVVAVGGGTEPYSFSWSSGHTTSTAVNLSSGMYTVTITDAIGCSVTLDVNIIAVGIEDELVAGLNKFDVYPNPNSGLFTIDIELAERDDLQIYLLDLQGREVYANEEKAALNYEKNIDVSRLATGLYMLKVATSKGAVFKRVIID